MSELQEQIIAAIKTVKDPELPINIYDLGLIRKLDIENGAVHISMTLFLGAYFYGVFSNRIFLWSFC